MKLWKKDNRQTRIYSNNRINLTVAIIFLLGIASIIKLYNLQVREYDLYEEKATGQHQVFSILEPERGRIFVQDNKEGNDEKLYPIATNKEFALVYAVPKDVVNPERTSEKFFEIFKLANVIKEVDELMQKEDEDRLKKELEFLNGLNLPAEEKLIKEAEIIKEHEAIISDKGYLDLKNVKREKEIELRKEAAVSEYLKILTKENDPYEPIEQKVDEEDLKKLYASIAGNEINPIDINNLEIKDGKMFIVVNGGEKEELKLDGVAFIPKMRRFYTEGNIGSHMLGFVGYIGNEERGQYGLEGFFDEELFGVPGSIKTERGAGGDLIIINDREYEKPKNGNDLILTINKTIQYKACQSLNETVEKFEADGGSVIVMDPKTGAILTMCSAKDYDPNNYKEAEDKSFYNNPAIFAQYEPGSTFKTITMAAALDQEKVTPETTYNDEGSIMIKGWDKPIKNSDFETHGGWGETNMNIVLEKSLNTGAIFAMKQIGSEVFAKYVKSFGFGEKVGIELETESGGDIRNLLTDKVQEIYAATASFGQGITTTPLQMIASYAAIANGGILMKPYLVKEVIHANGVKDITQPKEIRRVISERAATLLSGMLVNAVENGHAKLAKVDGYFVAGKTGTAQVAAQGARGYSSKTIHTFIGFAPAEEPKFVMLVKLDNPKGARFAESSAVPLFGDIAKFLLNYLEVPKER